MYIRGSLVYCSVIKLFNRDSLEISVSIRDPWTRPRAKNWKKECSIVIDFKSISSRIFIIIIYFAIGGSGKCWYQVIC